MDTNLALLSTGTGGTLIGILIIVYKTINKKRLRSNCCGIKTEVSLDIDTLTPSNQQTSPSFVVENPLGKSKDNHPETQV
jgi:hypothetical protein